MCVWVKHKGLSRRTSRFEYTCQPNATQKDYFSCSLYLLACGALWMYVIQKIVIFIFFFRPGNERQAIVYARLSMYVVDTLHARSCMLWYGTSELRFGLQRYK